MTTNQSTSSATGPRRANLAEQIVHSLRARLEAGELQPGDRLPTEKELSQTHGVSRTVVREAIAALRADGWVIARQGSGVFAADRSKVPNTATLFKVDAAKFSSIIEVLELRIAVEGEAASLAAQRSSPAELAKIRECHSAIGKAVAAGDLAEQADFALHHAIAESTHNQHFVEFFRFLGSRTIPRAQLPVNDEDSQPLQPYLERLHEEHGKIVDALARKDPDNARAAMQDHLRGSLRRYARIAGMNDISG